jgi:septal ring factor EnvC (AmiA/AmiB activator)
MSDLFFAAAAVKDTIADNRDTIGVIIGAASSLIVGVLAFLSGKKKAAKSEFSELVAANIKFRDEIKAELNDARVTIEGLKKTIEEKGKLIDEMQTAIADLKQQLIVKETRISDMQMDMIKKDYQIQVLQDNKS